MRKQKLNAAWHRRNRMPKNPTLARRAAWHRAHARLCACRPMPAGLRTGLRRQTLRRRSREATSRMIRRCTEKDFNVVLEIINDAAQAYRGVIPADRWKEPYMTAEELRREIADGVRFWGCDDAGRLTGVMGLQNVKDVTLIRHAYVRTACRRQGIGSSLLNPLLQRARRPVLIGTWQAASWAIRFYQKHGFRAVPPSEAPELLRRYWRITARQVETSAVLKRSRGDQRRY